jgi:hypothetical protein
MLQTIFKYEMYALRYFRIGYDFSFGNFLKQNLDP